MNTVRVIQDKTAKLRDALRALQRDVVLVGIPADESSRNDDAPIGNASIGYIQENGSPVNNIPARPFLVPGVQSVADRCAELMAAGAAEMLDGGAAAIEKANNKAGLVAQAAVKNTLRAGEGFPPLADATLAARKRAGFTGTKPLIWTGQLLNSITYVIRKRNG